jgi:hypothetical protein
MKTILLCPCRFAVPLHLNDGTPVSAEQLADIGNALNRQFGGFTVIGERDGCWQDLFERSVWYLVAVPEEQIDALKAVVRIIGSDLGQRAMYFERGSPTVEIIEIA